MILNKRPVFSNRSPRTHSLSTVPAGTTVRIGAVEGDRTTRFRLLELGFTPGQEITPVASAPFGGPVAVALRGTIVALRSAEADCIRL
ncbi:MAG: ferrous iron transport protein A [Candidatus Sericytochromatia bacterium]|uniref:Ferrous iron transport protein A n=1 Tax=Candidatus Tanganyikabacteria bacterium TaxID=2961651 RepID=A0A937X2D3_9BACT|nr:ferrous iron transport protein A [Candidatus Tanganyikabacteria bacterium]